MYRVLYRKWRPKTFEDVTGQPQVTQTLKQELVAGELHMLICLPVLAVQAKQRVRKYWLKPSTV
ncbi:MAG: hypothetical protein ACLRX7_00790 [Acutalibacteraceae bacterium]